MGFFLGGLGGHRETADVQYLEWWLFQLAHALDPRYGDRVGEDFTVCPRAMV